MAIIFGTNFVVYIKNPNHPMSVAFFYINITKAVKGQSVILCFQIQTDPIKEYLRNRPGISVKRN
jgi:hypothetical protein